MVRRMTTRAPGHRAATGSLARFGLLLPLCLAAWGGFALIGAAPAEAAPRVLPDSGKQDDPPTVDLPPPDLEALKDVREGASIPNAGEIRVDAMREGAVSYGARGGLAYRSWQIGEYLKQYDRQLTSIYDFRRLLIAAPSGLMIEPPVVSEAQRALIVTSDGQEAAIADRVISIQREARIVSAPRDWRQYLERKWGEIDLPPDVLLPTTPDERKAWELWVQDGWALGVEQADEIFQLDLDRLTRDFEGMVRYRELLAQNMITAPFPNLADAGIEGDGNEMRVGSRSVTITGPSQLETRAEKWMPARR